MSDFIPHGYMPLGRAVLKARAAWFASEEAVNALSPEEQAILATHKAAVCAMQEFKNSRRGGVMTGETMDKAVETPLIAALKNRFQRQNALWLQTWRHLRGFLFSGRLPAFALVDGVGWYPIRVGQWVGKQADTPPPTVPIVTTTRVVQAPPFIKEGDLEGLLASEAGPPLAGITASITVPLLSSLPTGEVDVYGAPLGINAIIGRSASDAITAPSASEAHSRFWRGDGRREWPADRPGHLFLARAFHVLGQSRYGSEWIGTEPYGPIQQNILHLAKSPKSMTDADKALLARMGEGIKEAGSPEAFWAVERKRLAEQSWAATQRAQTVRLEITRECEAGRLLAAWEPPGGGELVPIPPEHWSKPVVALSRFFWCQMSPDMPFGVMVGGRGFGYIFIERSSLHRVLTGNAVATAPAEHTAAQPRVRARTMRRGNTAVLAAKLKMIRAVLVRERGAKEEGHAETAAERAPTEQPKRKRNYPALEESDAALASALLRLERHYDKARADGVPVARNAMAEHLAKAAPHVVKDIGSASTLRRILGGHHDRVNRLVAAGVITPWWKTK